MPASDVETVILRFRDYAPPGQTISAHQDLITKTAGVWWGWWAKSEERVPIEAFTRLDHQAKTPGKLRLFLLDSGRRLLYPAVCQRIEWEKSGENLPTPERARTPDYYGDVAWPAWFQLAEIGPPIVDPAAALKDFAYVRVDEFFVGGVSHYDRFDDKIVASMEELLQQNRTMWFVRAARPSDRKNEILLLNASNVEPSHFPPRFIQTASKTLLWVSDLHFGRQPFTASADGSTAPLGRSLQRELRDLPLGGVIVSGDLAWKAQAEEFKAAAGFVREISARSPRLDPYQVALCPGNHDLRFSADPSRKDAEVTVAPEQARAAFASFYEELFFLQPNAFLSSGRRLLLGNALPVEMVCLNTSLLVQAEALFQGHGYVGEDQLEDAAKQMGWVDSTSPTPLRMLVLHHHLLPVTYREQPKLSAIYSVVLDAEAIIRWIIRHRVKLVLHGHMHSPYYAQITRAATPAQHDSGTHTFHVLGLGSTGVDADHLGDPRENMFATLEFGTGYVDVAYRKVHPTIVYEEDDELYRLRLPTA